MEKNRIGFRYYKGPMLLQSGVNSFITKWDNFIIKWNNYYKVVLNCLFSKKAKSEKKLFFSKLRKDKFNSVAKKGNEFLQRGCKRRHYVRRSNEWQDYA